MREFITKGVYKLVLNEGATEYEVINTDTGVVEFKHTSLPRCMIVTEEYADALARLTPKPEPVELPTTKNVFRIGQREDDDAPDSRTTR